MNTQLPAHQKFVEFAERLADTSRQIILEAIKHAPEVELKADASYVTTTDKAVEAKLREMIAATYPEHGILGEEFESLNLDAEFVWVLDPIDGTAPFIAGIPVYGTLIGLAWNGKPFVGVIDHPATADRWVGVANLYAKRNGVPVFVKDCGGLHNAFVTCSNPDFMTELELVKFTKLRKLVPYVQYGGSCFVYGTLASGRTDLAIDSGLETFDVFASIAVIQGAGGYMTDWNGREITLDWSGRVIAAGSRDCLDAAIDMLKID